MPEESPTSLAGLPAHCLDARRSRPPWRSARRPRVGQRPSPAHGGRWGGGQKHRPSISIRDMAAAAAAPPPAGRPLPREPIGGGRDDLVTSNIV